MLMVASSPQRAPPLSASSVSHPEARRSLARRTDGSHACLRRFEKLAKETAGGASCTRTIFGFYSRRPRLSAGAIAVVDGLMCINAKRRWGVCDALRHEWVRG